MFIFPLLDALVLATVLPSSNTRHQIFDLALQQSVHDECLSAIQVAPIRARCYVVLRLPTYGRTGIMVARKLPSEHVMTATAAFFSWNGVHKGDGCHRANIVHGCPRGRKLNRSIVHLAACCKLRFPIGLVIAVGQSLPIWAISGTTTLRCCILPGEDSSADSIPIPLVVPSLSSYTPSPNRRPP
jgi:hypothetical protein